MYSFPVCGNDSSILGYAVWNSKIRTRLKKCSQPLYGVKIWNMSRWKYTRHTADLCWHRGNSLGRCRLYLSHNCQKLYAVPRQKMTCWLFLWQKQKLDTSEVNFFLPSTASAQRIFFWIKELAPIHNALFPGANFISMFAPVSLIGPIQCCYIF